LSSPLPAQAALATWLTETFGADAARVAGKSPA